MKSAIIPGSFDPVTKGHIDIIRRASEIFDKVYPVVLINAEKAGMFTSEQKLKILKCACRNIKNAECCAFDGLTSDFAAEKGARYIVKGARCATDFDYENNLAEIMKKFDSSLETVILPASPSLAYISSSYAREKISHNCPLDDVADEETAKLILSIFNGNE